MSKAYDRVKCDFLEKLMLKIGFDIIWDKWIMACVTTVTYSILINDHSHDFIKIERWTRQGGPLAPFLFILCVEALVHNLDMNLEVFFKDWELIPHDQQCIICFSPMIVSYYANWMPQRRLKLKDVCNATGRHKDMLLTFQKSSISSLAQKWRMTWSR